MGSPEIESILSDLAQEANVSASTQDQMFNGVLLPVILVTMLVLINDQRLMGKFKNGRIFNILAWTTAIVLIVLIVLAIILIILTFFA